MYNYMVIQNRNHSGNAACIIEVVDRTVENTRTEHRADCKVRLGVTAYICTRRTTKGSTNKQNLKYHNIIIIRGKVFSGTR